MQSQSIQTTMENLQLSTIDRLKTAKSHYLCLMDDKEKSNRLDEEESLTPYTMEEIYAMIDESERDIAAGRFFTTEEVFREIGVELNRLRLENT